MEQTLININDTLKAVLAEKKTRYSGCIHHYTSPEGLEGILTKKEIWFSNTKFLNDSSENNYIYSLFPRYCDTYSECLLDQKYFEIINTIADQYLQRDYCCIDGNRLWAENIFVASFILFLFFHLNIRYQILNYHFHNNLTLPSIFHFIYSSSNLKLLLL